MFRYRCFEFYRHQVDVKGDITTLDLASLISQTEYNVVVTPIYAEGPGKPMLGNAVTGRKLLFIQFAHFFFIVIKFLSHTHTSDCAAGLVSTPRGSFDPEKLSCP